MRSSVARTLLYYPALRISRQDIRAFLPEYLSRDRLTAAELERYQGSRLRELISWAGQNVAHYQTMLSSRGAGPSSDHEELDGVALLTKDTLRATPCPLTSSRIDPWTEAKTTSGSTGHPVTVYKNPDAVARERAATWRAYAWAGIPVAAPHGFLWGMPLTSRGKVRARFADLCSNRIRLSMFGVTEERLADFHRRLSRFRPDYLYGYVSAIKSFLEFTQATRVRLPASIKSIVTTSELLDTQTRDYIESSTGVRVFNEYGCGEVGSIAHECEHGGFHVMSDNLVLECITSPELPDGLGELVVTDLFNRASPLIRYRLGDLGQLDPTTCECGRPYPRLSRVVGRAYDMLEDAAGRLYHAEAVLYVFEDLRRAGLIFPPYQAIQSVAGQLTVNFQASRPLDAELAKTLEVHLIRAFGGNMQVALRTVLALARETSGKLRVVKRESRVNSR